MGRNILYIVFLINYLVPSLSLGQGFNMVGLVTEENGLPIPFASVSIEGSTKGALANEDGLFELSSSTQKFYIQVSAIGFKKIRQEIILNSGGTNTYTFILPNENTAFDEVVVSGTLNPVTRLESPVPVEFYTPKFFQRNPTPNVFEALQNVNGLRPQINCNVCNTGDIHINGLEGPYTMVLLDGMPIVSGLSTVYGLSGIPNSLIERVEIVKGPASSLYGSEAVGGLINIITKSPVKAPKFSVDAMSSSWAEMNLDLGYKQAIGKNIQTLTGLNYYHYTNPKDLNADNFTDVTLQKRVSVFHKWSVEHSKNKFFNLAGRYFYEDRWGGEMNWKPEFRGGDEIYAESIYTKRWEVLGQYELPVKEDIKLAFSYNNHQQNSFYGTTPFHADQQISFAQLIWNKNIEKHNLLAGLAIRHTYYDDNTPATALETNLDVSSPQNDLLPGVFVQDEFKVNDKVRLLSGYRFDHHPKHGGIHTPRIALKYSPNKVSVIRLNAGTGFRVVNIFTEDHAALTGAREVIIRENLNPERSYNANLNYMTKIITANTGFIGLDFTAFYTYFTNRITPDYTSNAQLIIYDNLDGFAISKGLSANIDLNLKNGLVLAAGGTLMSNTLHENGIVSRPLLTEKFNGTWSASLPLQTLPLTIDYTGNLYSPMLLPVLGELDPRPENSTWWSIQNIQLTYNLLKTNLEIYAGIKNLLNFTPPSNSIARSFDPFDKEVLFNSLGEPKVTPNNPYALTFDPSYVFAPNQGRRGFLGLRWSLN